MRARGIVVVAGGMGWTGALCAGPRAWKQKGKGGSGLHRLPQAATMPSYHPISCIPTTNHVFCRAIKAVEHALRRAL